MSRSPRSSLARMTGFGAIRRMPISNTMSSAGPGAPPCSGPLSAPTAPAMAEITSDRVDTMTRAANVDAFRPWSHDRVEIRLERPRPLG